MTSEQDKLTIDSLKRGMDGLVDAFNYEALLCDMLAEQLQGFDPEDDALAVWKKHRGIS